LKARFLLVSAVLLLFCASAFAGTATRSLSSASVAPGADLTVTLAVDVSGDESYYAVDELVPAGWTIKDSGSAATEHTGHLKWVVIQNAVDTSYTYTLTAPSTAGQTTISGTVMFEGMDAEEAIGGQTSVTVSTGSTPGPGPGPSPAPAPTIDWTIVLIGIVLIALAALILPRVLKK
jgi:hypothetical protein